VSIALELPEELLDAVAKRAAQIVLEQTSEPDEWLTSDQAAQYLKCGRRRIFNLVSDGRIPVHREGVRLMFLKSELDAWIKSGRAMTV
jgi:excisionase family DNA binding protein